MSVITYRPEIDGLRAIAVLPVILFHLGWEWLPGGYLGVDVFFVISGYLITSIVHAELSAGRFSLWSFYARRIRRILPGLTVVTFVTLLYVWANFYKPEHGRIGGDALAGLASFANLRMWRSAGDYWGSLAAKSPFLHTWSLSVEEQFYLVFPVLVLWTARAARSTARLSAGMLAVATGSLILFLYGVTHHPTATFYLLPTRAWELAVGGCCALFTSRDRDPTPRDERARGLGLAGLALILAGYVLQREFHAGTIVPVIGTAMILVDGDAGACRRLLSADPLRWIGKLSYSLYLWHWPVIVLSTSPGHAASKSAQFGLIVLLSIASYHAIEQPARKRAGIVPGILAAYCGVLLFAVTLWTSSGDYDVSAFAPPKSDQLRYDLQPTNQLTGYFHEMYQHVSLPPRDGPRDAFLHGGIITAGAGDPELIVLGDSHGVMWAGAIRDAADQLGVKTAFWTMNGVTPFVDIPPAERQAAYLLTAEEKLAFDTTRLNRIAAWKPRVALICSARWTDPPYPDQLLAYLREHGVRVILMEPTPVLESQGRSSLNQLCFLGVRPRAGVRHYLPAAPKPAGPDGASVIAKLCREYDNCELLPVRDLYMKGDSVLALDGLELVFVDGSHLTTHGARIALPRITDKLRELLSRSP